MIEELDQRRLVAGLARSSSPVKLVLHPAEDSPKANERLAQVAREYEVAAKGGLQVRPGDGRGLPALPALQIKGRHRTNLRYLALPEGHQAAPFVDALIGAAGGDLPTGEWVQRLAKLQRQVEVVVFVAAACAHCPQAVRAAIQLGLASENITVSVVDVQFFENLAERHQAKSVPLTVIDGEYSFVGVEPAAKLASKIFALDASDAETLVFDSLLEAGRFADAAEKVVGGEGLTPFLVAWTNSTTQIRIGLMLTVEQVFDRRRDALDALVPKLLPLLESEDAALRGDTADLFGQIGHADAAGPLKALLDDPNPDVAEIAEEAIDEIMERNG